VPCYLNADDIFRRTKHLMDNPGFGMLDKVFAPAAIDWSETYGHFFSVFYHFGAHAWC
jgi:hypothetical protein